MEIKRFAQAMVGHFLASLLYVLRQLRIIDAVVDTSSILDHREELRDLWEKRAMADDIQASPSSKMADEEGAEDKKVAATSPLLDQMESEKQELTPLKANGIAHHEDNCLDSLEEFNNEEGKTYTSELETELVLKKVNEIVSEAVVKTEEIIRETETAAIESVKTENEKKATEVDAEVKSQVALAEDLLVDTSLVDLKSEVKEVITETIVEIIEEKITQKEVVVTEVETLVSIDTEDDAKLVDMDPESQQEGEEARPPALVIELDIKETEEGDGFVRIEECLPQVEGAEEEEEEEEASAPLQVDEAVEEKTTVLTNGQTTPTASPSPAPPAHQPDLEQFVKAGGLKRLHQQHQQQTTEPYQACTTETKIAIEIREMREREEELRVRREQQVATPPALKSPTPRDTPQRLASPSPTPPTGTAYRVSSVFGSRGGASPSPPNSVFGGEERKLPWGGLALAQKETPMEKDCRLARDREEELRRQKGLPPREDDSYVKPSQVKSSQVRVFGAGVGAGGQRQSAATAKIQLEIEEQTRREMALRESGSIQTISQERTDARVAKLKSPTESPVANGNAHPLNGTYTNGRSSPDSAPLKRGTPSPTGLANHRPASIFSSANGKGVSMQKFIASKGREPTTPRLFPQKEGVANLKRSASVESKIQQEIMEMKQREEELKLLHVSKKNGSATEEDEDGIELQLDSHNNNSISDYNNGNGVHHDEELSPRHNNLIAQWEQRIQKAES